MRLPNQKKRYAALNKRLNKYVSMVQEIYDTLAMEASHIAASVDYEDGVFRFSDFPETKKQIDDVMSFFFHDLHTLVYSGTTREWEESNIAQDLLANKVLKAYRADRGELTKYYLPNEEALKAFQQRRINGLNLSQKLWQHSNDAKRAVEGAISAGIEKGVSAVALSKRVSRYLRDWDTLQKDYKEKFGSATTIQNCEYRSIRLVRSEINMSYRTAEQLRWQQMDFIKGYEIKTSGAHPKEDICDELKGVYPKSFHWTGWHPNCMCYAIPIVMSEDEYWSGNGEEIAELPNGFINWVYDNQERIETWREHGTTPYFISDNIGSVRKAQKKGENQLDSHPNQL